MPRRAGYDPRRRNKNIGTAKQGRGSNNKMVIPDPWHDSKRYLERLKSPIKVKREVNDKTYTFLVERTHKDFFYPCTVDDVAHLLSYFPEKDTEELSLIVFRQPTKKQKQLCSVWGRLQYWYSSMGEEGAAVILEAQRSRPSKRRWTKALDPSDVKELERLRSLGHPVTLHKRYWQVEHTPELDRSTQLYRTLAHEIGHWLDYLNEVERPNPRHFEDYDFEKWSRLFTLYMNKPSREKEEYAHRYAGEFHKRMEKLGVLPFSRKFDEGKMVSEGLRVEDFMPAATP